MNWMKCINIRLMEILYAILLKLWIRKHSKINIFTQKTPFSEVHWFCGKHKCTSVNIQTSASWYKQWRLLIIDIPMYIPYVRTEDIPTRQNWR